MRWSLKTPLIIFILLLLVLHGTILFLFFGPVQTVLRFSGFSTQNFTSIEETPSDTRQTFAFAENSPELLLPEPQGGWQRLNQVILKGRYERMEEADRFEVILNTLPFGEDIYGLNAASFYYFQKPLNQLTEQEVVNLAGFFRVFRK